jgi:hypothetical protein
MVNERRERAIKWLTDSGISREMAEDMTRPEEQMVSDQRYDHYYSLEADGEFEDGHIFCTIAEGVEIKAALRAALPDVDINVELGGEYDFTTDDGTTAEAIAADIAMMSGFLIEEDDE